MNLNERTRFVFGSAGGHLYLCDGAYRSECFSAKTHRTEGEQVLRFAYLTGCVSLECQTGIHFAHSDTIVYDLKQRAPCVANDDLDALSAGIQAVLDELL